MELITLENGTRIALSERGDALSAAIHIFVGCGSYSEDEKDFGAAHFIEHMLFKGSEKYTSREIAAITDMFGGNINAFTTKEYTCYFAKVLPEHLADMLDVMCDMVTRPKFDAEAIDTEKGVILEEIGMYEDSPEDLGFDLLGDVIWQGSSLAHPILGRRETVSAATHESLKAFWGKHYTPSKTVISVCGRFDKEQVVRKFEETFGKKENSGEQVAVVKAEFHPEWILHKKDTEQSHVFLTFPGVALDSPLRHAIALFTEITGGGASSRLYLKIREELGLVYNTYAYNTSYLGCGAFGMWAALSHGNQKRFIEEALKILDDMRSFDNEEELYRVKQQFKANTIMAIESTSGTASAIGKQILLKNEYVDAETTAKLIDAVTTEQIREVAKLFFDVNKLALCVVGKPEEKEFYEEIVKKYR